MSLAIVGQPMVVSRRRVECRNGDPACDLDGDGCDRTCTFGVVVCLNDPDQPDCTPPFPPLALVRVNARKDARDLDVPPLDTVGCGEVRLVEVPLRTRHEGKAVKAGKGKLEIVAIAPIRPRRDKDKVRIVCLPPESDCVE